LRRVALLLGFVVGVFGQGLPKVSGNDVWITREISWHRAPPEYNPNLSTGSATILYFRPDGRFGLMHCRLNKGPTYLVVSHGDGQAISEGSWKVQPDGIAVSYRLVSTSVPRIPSEKLPGPEKSSTIQTTTSGMQKLGDQTFVSVGNRLHASELDPEFFNFLKTREQ
jgi:hypothetical protein